jgi:hypothetical protein
MSSINDACPTAEEEAVDQSTDPPESAEVTATARPPRGRRGTPANGQANRPAGLTKISANFTPRATTALQTASELSGDNQTDVLNRSVQVYAYICKLEHEGKLIFTEDPATGMRERIVLL